MENTVVSSGENVFVLGHVEPGKFLTAVGESASLMHFHCLP